MLDMLNQDCALSANLKSPHKIAENVISDYGASRADVAFFTLEDIRLCLPSLFICLFVCFLYRYIFAKKVL